MEKISNRLNKALNLRNMKPIELSEKTNIDKGSISCYLSGRYDPKSKNIYKIAKVLDVNPVWLLGYDVPMDNNINAISANNQIMLWDNLWGYNKNDNISFKELCKNVSLDHRLLKDLISMCNYIIPSLNDFIKTIDNENFDKDDEEIMNDFTNIIIELYNNYNKINSSNKKSKKQSNTINTQKFEVLRLLKENEKLLNELLEQNVIDKKFYEKKMQKYNNAVKKELDYVEKNDVIFNIIFEDNNQNENQDK